MILEHTHRHSQFLHTEAQENKVLSRGFAGVLRMLLELNIRVGRECEIELVWRGICVSEPYAEDAIRAFARGGYAAYALIVICIIFENRFPQDAGHELEPDVWYIWFVRPQRQATTAGVVRVLPDWRNMLAHHVEAALTPQRREGGAHIHHILYGSQRGQQVIALQTPVRIGVAMEIEVP
jgi:hypothetical protein